MSKGSSTIDWDDTIKRWKKSGISQRRFCAQAEISLRALRSHLKSHRQKTGFIEVSESFRNKALSSAIEVMLPFTGVTIRIQPGFCSHTLRQLIEVLGGETHVR
jgi:hypothetical protein